ncbi:MAG: type II secretion system major pseudopilin GspG [Legionellales bacterium]|nr:type II secretion system major pseudopilin GspG [Legionellales bacterium]
MKKQQGFTLIEIMVVVVILGILAAIVVPKILDRPEQARLVKAQQDIQSIAEALDLYKLDNGNLPTTDQGLQALVSKPTSDPIPNNWHSYLKSLPIDPWGHPYQYLIPGQHGEYDLFSYGPQGQGSEQGLIGNWTNAK